MAPGGTLKSCRMESTQSSSSEPAGCMWRVARETELLGHWLLWFPWLVVCASALGCSCATWCVCACLCSLTSVGAGAWYLLLWVGETRTTAGALGGGSESAHMGPRPLGRPLPRGGQSPARSPTQQVLPVLLSTRHWSLSELPFSPDSVQQGLHSCYPAGYFRKQSMQSLSWGQSPGRWKE